MGSKPASYHKAVLRGFHTIHDLTVEINEILFDAFTHCIDKFKINWIKSELKFNEKEVEKLIINLNPALVTNTKRTWKINSQRPLGDTKQCRARGSLSCTAFSFHLCITPHKPQNFSLSYFRTDSFYTKYLLYVPSSLSNFIRKNQPFEELTRFRPAHKPP